MAEIIGDAGNNSLYGASDADTVSGEGANDYLEGATASDVYLFDLGDGQDTIYDNGSTDPGEVDVLAFGTGIAPTDITVT